MEGVSSFTWRGEEVGGVTSGQLLVGGVKMREDIIPGIATSPGNNMVTFYIYHSLYLLSYGLILNPNSSCKAVFMRDVGSSPQNQFASLSRVNFSASTSSLR